MSSMLFLFQSTHAVLKAERILLDAGIVCTVIPVPKSISSECGICISAAPENLGGIRRLLAASRISAEERAHDG